MITQISTLALCLSISVLNFPLLLHILSLNFPLATLASKQSWDPGLKNVRRSVYACKMSEQIL